MEVGANNRSVMPLDVLGRTRATLAGIARTLSLCLRDGRANFKSSRDGDRALELLLLNKEYLVIASHYLALTLSLPFVHTARRYYRSSGPVRFSDLLRPYGRPSGWGQEMLTELGYLEEVKVVTRFP